MYACDSKWWDCHQGCADFKGEKWSSHNYDKKRIRDDKSRIQNTYGINLVSGTDGIGFSADPEVIHYGSNSGFQALNLALLFGGDPIILVGFDMRVVEGKRHFFGDHPPGLSNTTTYQNFVAHFDRAMKKSPTAAKILNATPGSALTCFPMVDPYDVL